jgi:hypothetical protein
MMADGLKRTGTDRKVPNTHGNQDDGEHMDQGQRMRPCRLAPRAASVNIWFSLSGRGASTSLYVQEGANRRLAVHADQG